LFALRAAIYLSVMGPQGMQDVANLCTQKAHYAAEQLIQHDRFELAFSNGFFKEFVVRDTQNDVQQLLQQACENNILAGLPLGQWYDELEDCLLITITEKRTKQEIDNLVNVLTQ
jgi:glycine dehydrogenase subunit 1